jgi:tetratricopeptide (TPR) repeat protein
VDSDALYALAIEAGRQLLGPQQRLWLDRLEENRERLETLLDGFITDGDTERALTLTGALAPFWWMRGHTAAGQERMGRVLALPGGSAAARAAALVGAGSLAYAAGDFRRSRALYEQALPALRVTGNELDLARALDRAGMAARQQMELAQAQGLHAEALEVLERVGTAAERALCLNNLGVVAFFPSAARPQPKGDLRRGRSRGYRGVCPDPLFPRSHPMLSFIHHHADRRKGVLSGLDRSRCRGTLRALAHPWGLRHFLQAPGVLLKEFKGYGLANTRRRHRATEQRAAAHGRPFVYLRSSATSKEDRARPIAQRDGLTHGLIAVFRAVEPCWSFEVVSHPRRFLQLRACTRKGLHYDPYFLDPDFGLRHVRGQSWLPFFVHVCLNGRERLARQLDQLGLGYVRRDNCLVDVADFARAQELLRQQGDADWSARRRPWARRAVPVEAALRDGRPLDSSGSVNESAWATDVVFHAAADLAGLYPRLVRHGIEVRSCHDGLRYLGRKQPERCPTAEVRSDYPQRREGLRRKHRLHHNVLKRYDQEQVVLRVETVIHNPEDCKGYRTAEGDEGGARAWRTLRKGVADLPRRLEVSQKANERYLEALAAVEVKQSLGELAAAVCRPARWRGQRVRALNPLAEVDGQLLAAVRRGAFARNGFRNRDLRPVRGGAQRRPGGQGRRQSAAGTRQLRLLRAHGLIHKVAHTHR